MLQTCAASTLIDSRIRRDSGYVRGNLLGATSRDGRLTSRISGMVKILILGTAISILLMMIPN